MGSKHWEHFPHEADMGIRGIGRTRDEAFEQAALAMTAVITDPSQVDTTEMVEITRQAPADELLLVDWLTPLFYELATRNRLSSRFEAPVQDHVLTPRASGEPMNTAKHHM